MNGDPLIYVRRHPNDCHLQAGYRLSKIQGFKWDQTSGVRQARLNGLYLHCYVNCQEAEVGEVGHTGLHQSGCPHSIKVCITKGANRRVYSELLKLAPPKPASA